MASTTLNADGTVIIITAPSNIVSPDPIITQEGDNGSLTATAVCQLLDNCVVGDTYGYTPAPARKPF